MALPLTDTPELETLVSFKSGHYKKIIGKWKGDSVWCHFQKADGGMIHVNKDEVEYIESFGPKKGIQSGIAHPDRPAERMGRDAERS